MICVFNKNSIIEYVKLQNQLRSAGISAEIYSGDGNLKTQMRYANNIGVSHVLVLGQEELEKGSLVLRDMLGGSQRMIGLESVVQEISSL